MKGGGKAAAEKGRRGDFLPPPEQKAEVVLPHLRLMAHRAMDDLSRASTVRTIGGNALELREQPNFIDRVYRVFCLRMLEEDG